MNQEVTDLRESRQQNSDLPVNDLTFNFPKSKYYCNGTSFR
ncbi:hypothetical protein ACFSKI_06335 [Pseudogracilibacillus auburnensis]|nr:hypothetical protein [Pseudogracilibacillus auburnensis]